MQPRRHRLAAFAVLIAVLALIASTAACGRGGTSPSTASQGISTRTVTIDTRDGSRTAIVHRPVAVPAHPALVVMLHGGFGSGSQAEKAYGWDDLANSEGFEVAYPNGESASWNVGTCCGQAHARGLDDTGFLHALVKQLVDTDGVDPAHVYAVGMSNGAMMSYAWACMYPQDLAGIGPVSGSLLADCPHPAPMTVIAIHGTADENVPINGGVGPKGVRRADNPSLAQSLAPFEASDGCPTSGSVTGTPPVHITTLACGHGTRVVTAIIDGAGHQWPGSTPESPAIHKAMGLDAPDPHLNATSFLWNELRNGHP